MAVHLNNAAEVNEYQRKPWTDHRTFLSLVREQERFSRTSLYSSHSNSTQKTSARETYLWVLTILWYNFFLGMCYSSISPFFNLVCEECSSLETIIILCVPKVLMVFCTVFAERIMSWSSPGYLLNSSVAINGVAFVLVGILYWCPPGRILFGLSTAIFVFAAIGFSSYWISAYSVMVHKFPGIFVMVIAFSEAAWGVGWLAGPIVGQRLIQAWALPLPFFVYGGCLLFGIVISGIFPPGKGLRRCSSRSIECEGIFRLVCSPCLWIDAITIALVFFTMEYNQTFLRAHLEKDLTTGITEADYLAMIQWAAYSLGVILFATFILIINCEPFLSFAAQLLSFLAYLLLGPADFIPQNSNFILTDVGLAVAGVGMAGQFIPSVSHAMLYTWYRGFPKSIRNVTIVIAFMYTFMYLGGFAGAVVSRCLLDILLFTPRQITLIPLIVHGTWAVIKLLALGVDCIYFRRKSLNQRLIEAVR